MMVFGRLVTIGVGPVEVLPEKHQTDDPSCFAVHCFMRLGTSAGAGTQDQRVLVCSPAWLLEVQPPNSALRGQGLLLMQRYDGEALNRSVRRFAERCTGATAKEVFEKLARLGFSEFEDYNREPMPSYFIDDLHENQTLGPVTT